MIKNQNPIFKGNYSKTGAVKRKTNKFDLCKQYLFVI